jgi:hypothetical protein
MTMIATLRRWWTGLLKRAGDVVDVFKPRGYVEATLRYAHGPKKGEVYKTFYGRNIVTSWLSGGGAAPTSGRDLMRRLLVPAALPGSLNGAVDAYVDQIQLGSGTTAETSADTALETPLVPSTMKVLTSVDFDLVNTYITFVFDYDETEANATISEAALYSGPTRNDFIARKTFGSFTKTTDFTLQIRWQIRF